MHYLNAWLSESPEWSAHSFALINPQLDYSGSWCSSTRHVRSQISSWRVAAGWDLPALFFSPAELKACSWPRKAKWLGEGLFLTQIDTRYLEMSLALCSCSACWHRAETDYSEPSLSVFLVRAVDDLWSQGTVGMPNRFYISVIMRIVLTL